MASVPIMSHPIAALPMDRQRRLKVLKKMEEKAAMKLVKQEINKKRKEGTELKKRKTGKAPRLDQFCEEPESLLLSSSSDTQDEPHQEAYCDLVPDDHDYMGPALKTVHRQVYPMRKEVQGTKTVMIERKKTKIRETIGNVTTETITIVKRTTTIPNPLPRC